MNKTASKNFEAMISLIKEFHDLFIEDENSRSEILKTPKIEIYARCNKIGSQNHFCLSTIDIDPMIQNQRVLTLLLLFIEEALTFDSMSVESVLSPRLANFLKRNGFEVTLDEKSSFDFNVHCKNLTKKFNKDQIT